MRSELISEVSLVYYIRDVMFSVVSSVIFSGGRHNCGKASGEFKVCIVVLNMYSELMSCSDLSYMKFRLRNSSLVTIWVILWSHFNISYAIIYSTFYFIKERALSSYIQYPLHMPMGDSVDMLLQAVLRYHGP